MPQYTHPVAFEVAGPSAMFTRPDSGSSPVSYPAPTRGAARALFESIARLQSAYVTPTRVEICNPIRFERYTTHYRGPLRLDKRHSYQLVALRLINVCYRIYGYVQPLHTTHREPSHPLRALQALFNRRLEKGQCHYTPFLGWKECTPTYFGPLREQTQIDRSIDRTIPSMLLESFTHPGIGHFSPRYAQNVSITAGVLTYDQ